MIYEPGFIRPRLETDNPDIDRAFAIAVDDLLLNVAPFRDGLLERPEPVILAGKGYDTPWTRDAAINVWNGAGLLLPRVSKNTLLSVLAAGEKGPRAGGQYWDAVIWTLGAWHYWLYTHDEAFYELSKAATVNTLEYFEATEFDADRGLFRGPACYGDGVSAYPDCYAAGDSGILSFTQAFPDRVVHPGYGIPIYTLSTNCLYCEAYRVAHRMTGDSTYLEKAAALKRAINEAFWNEEKGLYDYALDDAGRCDAQEALGMSFALMFSIAEETRAQRILASMVVTPQGVPCLYPSFERYRALGYGRHSGTVWPHAQAFWATAAAPRSAAAFERELLALTRNVLREGQFYEIYHPETGLPYGGVQENHGAMEANWVSQPHQTWSATGYLRMILSGLIGLEFGEDGVRVRPTPIDSVRALRLSGLRWRGRALSVYIDDFSKTAVISDKAQGANPMDDAVLLSLSLGTSETTASNPNMPASATGDL